MHQNDITPSVKPKKAIHKHPNKHWKVRSGLQSVFQSQNYQVCDASKRHHPFCYSKESNPQTSEQTSEGQIRSSKCFSITELSGLWCIKTTSPLLLSQRKQSTNIRTNIGRSDQVSEAFFNHRTIRSVMHENDITPSVTPKKAIHKHPNKHRKVRSGLQSAFQSQNYQVCDASKRHHPFCYSKESNPQTSKQTLEGQIRSPKCFSITELSGLWYIKTTSPLLLSQRKQSTNPNKHRKVRSGLQSVFQSQNYQVCDASKRHHPFC